MKFNWDGFTREKFEKYCEAMRVGEVIDGSYIGCVRVGELCADIMYVLGFKETLNYDFYVGGVDTGYGYNRDGYPYDYADGGSFDDVCTSMNYDDFKMCVENELEQFIVHNPLNYKEASLFDKANAPLNLW